MSLRTLEAAILVGARKVLNNNKLRQHDIQEWSTGDIKPRDGEVVVRVEDPGVYVAVEKVHDKRQPR